MEDLADLGVGVGWHFRAAHLHPFYRNRYGYKLGAFPVAERISRRTLSLPLSAALGDREVERVIDAVRSLDR